MAGSLLFAASFALISVACDYRYLYLLDLAAMAGAPLRRARSAGAGAKKA